MTIIGSATFVASSAGSLSGVLGYTDSIAMLLYRRYMPARFAATRHRRGDVSIALVFALSAVSLAGQGCRDTPTGESSQRVAPVAPSPSVAGASLSRRDGAIWRPLTDEASRAELVLQGARAGLFIDFGSPDEHKYTRGSWTTGWSQKLPDRESADESRDGSRSEPTASTLAGERAQLDVVVPGPVRELVMRVRTHLPGQRVSALVDNRHVAGQAVAREWSVVRIPVPDGLLSAGRHVLTLRTTRAEALHIDWLWLAQTTGQDPSEWQARVGPLALGGQPKRALLAPSARAYRFYFTPEVGDFLVFAYGARTNASFAVSAGVDGSARELLFAAPGVDSWVEGAVDLSRFAGQAVALTLSRSGADGPAGFAEPVIMRRRPAAATATEQPAREQANSSARRGVRRGAQRPENAVLIVIDTARADVFGPLAGQPPGGAEVATPSYDRLAGESVVFTRAYNNENWTKPSVASTLSGIYPSTHGAKYRDSAIPQELELLPQYLQRRGFDTAGFVANGYVSGKFGFDKGWGVFRNYIREQRRSEAEHVYRDALSWLAQRKDNPQRFFLYIQTIDPHVEYRVPERFTQRYFAGRYTGSLGPSVNASEQRLMSRRKTGGSARDTAWLRALYYGELTYHDEYMGEFLRALDKLGVRENTLIAITNDHGEELGERGRYGHGHSMYQEMLRAPLLLHYPPLFKPGARIGDVVEHVDVAPTIVDALGLAPMTRAEGQSLLPLVAGAPIARPAYAIAEFQDGHRALRIADYSYRQGRDGAVYLYHLGSDPGERDNLGRSHPIARRMCEVYLGEGLATPDKRRRLSHSGRRRQMVAPRLELDPKLKREFEALGYFGDDGGDDNGDDNGDDRTRAVE